jgi:phospholipase/carboxylesterase
MPRFFRRHAEGVFDEEDVRRRANELADFVEAAGEEYGTGRPVALGFSNGANIAAATLLLRPDALAGAILLRAMVPLSQPPKVDLSDKRVLMISGLHDPIVPRENAAELKGLLAARGANVEAHALPVGHQLAQADVTLAQRWIAGRGTVRLEQAS